jgi:hypothetical protein
MRPLVRMVGDPPLQLGRRVLHLVGREDGSAHRRWQRRTQIGCRLPAPQIRTKWTDEQPGLTAENVGALAGFAQPGDRRSLAARRDQTEEPLELRAVPGGYHRAGRRVLLPPQPLLHGKGHERLVHAQFGGVRRGHSPIVA